MTRRTPLALALAAALPLIAAPAGATTTEHASGTVTFVSGPARTTDLANGGKVMRVESKGVLLDDNAKSPVNLSPVDCTGSLIIGADGKPGIETGLCQVMDHDGDTWALWYENGPRGDIWKVIDGTGKYARMTGGGTTRALFQGPDWRAVLHWQGTLER